MEKNELKKRAVRVGLMRDLPKGSEPMTIKFEVFDERVLLFVSDDYLSFPSLQLAFNFLLDNYSL
jgi:hypothetical protein